MSVSTESKAKKVLKTGVAFIPWILASYAFFWLHDSGTWTVDTPHRGKISVVILASGMVVSFLLHSYLNRKSGNQQTN